MADNITTTSGTLSTVPANTKISTDEDATNGHVQRVKLAYSADGVSTHVQADADGMLVNLGANNDVTVTGTVTANAGTGTFTVDGSGVTQPVSDAGGSLTVDNAALSVTGGGVEASALRVTIASDSTGLVSIDDGGGSLTVDGTVAVSGTVTVDGSGVTQPVSGTVTANLGATDNAVLDNIDTNTSTTATNSTTIAAAVAAEGAALGSGVLLQGDDGTDRKNINVDATTGDVQVDVTNTVTVDGSGVTQPVSNAGLTELAAAINSSRVDVNIAADSVGIGGGTQYAVDTAAGGTDTGTMALAVRDDTLTTLTPADGDYVPLRVNSTGALHVTGAGGGTQYNVDDAGPTVVTMAGVVRDDTLTTLTEVDGDATVLRVSSTGALHVTGGGGGTEYTDDTSTHATGSSVGNLMMAAATPTDGSVDANDIGAVAMSTDRRLHVDAQIVGQDADVTIADGGNSITVDNAALSVTGGGVEATALRVTIANDSTGVVSVDDNGGSLTVDGTVAVSGTVTVDGSGVTQPVSDAGGSLTVDNAGLTTADLDTGAGTDTRGVMGIALAESGGATVVGSANPLPISDAGGSLTVDGTVTANAGTGPWPVTDNGGALTVDWNGTAPPIGAGVEATALRVTLATDSTGVVSIDDNGSTISIDDGAGSITVDGTVAISGTVTVDTELPAAATMADAAANGSTSNIGARNMVYNGTTWDRARGNTTGTYVHGGTAHDAVDAGNPVKVGGVAYNQDGTAPGTAVAEGDRTNFINDVYGRQFVETAHPNLWQAMGLYSTAQTDVSVKAAPGAGLSLYITDIVVSTDTAFNCFFEQGTTKVYGTLYLAANGGASSHFRTPIKLPANTALTFTSSATANHSVTVNGYTAP